jgi:hypothetical protein
MEAKGWQGAPIQVVESNGVRYVTNGHHRLAAARIAGIPVRYQIVTPESLGVTLDEIVTRASEAPPNNIQRYLK